MQHSKKVLLYLWELGELDGDVEWEWDDDLQDDDEGPEGCRYRGGGQQLCSLILDPWNISIHRYGLTLKRDLGTSKTDSHRVDWITIRNGYETLNECMWHVTLLVLSRPTYQYYTTVK